MRPIYRLFRAWLWTLGVPLSPVPGWQARLRQYKTQGAGYIDEENGLLGAPLAWCLLARDPVTGKIVPAPSRCAVDGREIDHGTLLPPAREGEPPRVDAARFGARCARCGVPLHHARAGMVYSTDVPSCDPCRPAVERVLR